FTGPESETLDAQLHVPFDDHGNVVRDEDYQTSEAGVFVAGDAGRGQSLIVWAIAEGRAAASAVDRYLEGETQLPFPVRPTDRAIAV
ncbi:MAG: glutamate synthase, partial [Leifsonia sp.]|nr:glutamate synthase [Leifsonia sp.]